jgi:2,3-bisphosphoglycerate-dependent phosphoglycerate mutase
VGHSNTTPAFVNAVLGEHTYEDIDDNENGMLYIVKVTSEGATAKEKKIGN